MAMVDVPSRITIHKAVYGVDGARDVDIVSYLERHAYTLPKNLDLTVTFGDPYPNQSKYVHVQYTVHPDPVKVILEPGQEEGSWTMHGVPQVVEGCRRIGFVNDGIEGHPQCEYRITHPGMYGYCVVDASFDIDRMVVRSCENRGHDATEMEILDPPFPDWLMEVSSNGYVNIRECVAFDEMWRQLDDPFPNQRKRVEITYSRAATYDVVVFEHGGLLAKDVYLHVELPLYPMILAFHLFPRYQHPMMRIHWDYLRHAVSMFDRIVISIANMSSGDEHANEEKVRSMLGNPPNVDVLHTINTACRGEATSFQRMLSHVRNTCHACAYIFYAHSKGLTHYDPVQLRNVACWVELMYNGCLANVDVLLKENPMFAGNFSKHGVINGNPNPKWHYSGSYYWIRNDVLRRIHSIVPYATDYFLTERFPGLMSPSQRECLTLIGFPSANNHDHILYTTPTIRLYATAVRSYARHQLSKLAVG